jgi:hypothetical protein
MPDAMADVPTFQLPALPPEVENGEHDGGLEAFGRVRARLFGIAYRMLGSAA